MNAPSPDKQALRRDCAQKAAQMSAAQAQDSDARIFDCLISLPEYVRAHCVFTYVSVFPEPDTRRFIEYALASGKRVCVPLCLEGKRMQAKLISSTLELEPGVFGIPAPLQTQPCAECGEIGLAVVPGLCFGRKGERLGRGGGYYDRFLAQYAGFSVGLCRAAVFLGEVPEQAHDARVRAVITEQGVYRF